MTTKCTGLMGRIFGHKWVNCYRIRFIYPHSTVTKKATTEELGEARDKWSEIDDCFTEWVECCRCREIKEFKQYRMDGDKWTDSRGRCGAVTGAKP